MPPEIVAAGGVLYRHGDTGPEFAVVHRPRYGDWTLPKGKSDPGESLRATAEREVAEETGYAAVVGPELGTVAYRVSSGRAKAVRWWLMRADGGAFAPNEEVDELRWVDAAGATARVDYVRDRNVLAWATRRLEGDDRGRLYLVRHGSAGNRDEWEGPDGARPVSGRGAEEVAAITALLTELPVTRVLSSPHLRCVQSVEDLAASLGIELETDRRLIDRASLEPARRLIGELAGEAAVVSSHGDNIDDLLGVAAAEGADLDAGLVCEKGSTWLLETRGRRVLSGRYYPPGTTTS